MSSYVVDSWAWREYLDGTPKGTRVRDVVEKDREIFTTAASLAEVVSVAKRRGKTTAKRRQRYSPSPSSFRLILGTRWKQEAYMRRPRKNRAISA